MTPRRTRQRHAHEGQHPGPQLVTRRGGGRSPRGLLRHRRAADVRALDRDPARCLALGGCSGRRRSRCRSRSTRRRCESVYAEVQEAFAATNVRAGAARRAGRGRPGRAPRGGRRARGRRRRRRTPRRRTRRSPRASALYADELDRLRNAAERGDQRDDRRLQRPRRRARVRPADHGGGREPQVQGLRPRADRRGVGGEAARPRVRYTTNACRQRRTMRYWTKTIDRGDERTSRASPRPRSRSAGTRTRCGRRRAAGTSSRTAAGRPR